MKIKVWEGEVHCGEEQTDVKEKKSMRMNRKEGDEGKWIKKQMIQMEGLSDGKGYT